MTLPALILTAPFACTIGDLVVTIGISSDGSPTYEGGRFSIPRRIIFVGEMSGERLFGCSENTNSKQSFEHDNDLPRRTFCVGEASGKAKLEEHDPCSRQGVEETSVTAKFPDDASMSGKCRGRRGDEGSEEPAVFPALPRRIPPHRGGNDVRGDASGRPLDGSEEAPEGRRASGNATLPERLDAALIEQREAATRLGDLNDILAESDAEQRAIDDAILATHRTRGDRIVMAFEPRDLERRRVLFERKTGLAVRWGRRRVERKAAKAHLGACEREVKEIRREIARDQEMKAKRTGRAR